MPLTLYYALEAVAPDGAPEMIRQMRRVRGAFLNARPERLESRHPCLAAAIDPRTWTR